MRLFIGLVGVLFFYLKVTECRYHGYNQREIEHGKRSIPYHSISSHCGRRSVPKQYTPLERRSSKWNKRVTGGQESVRGEWPWLVSIYDIEDDEHFCGGTLISKSVILTAAHCFVDRKNKIVADPAKYGVALGEHTQSELYEENEVYAYLERIVLHENYNIKNVTDDIALLWMDGDVDLTENVNIGCLPDKRDMFPIGSTCLSAGWGDNGEGEGTDILKHIRVKIRHPQDCEDDYGDFRNGTAQICAGGTRTGHDTCEGDSGGPLMCHKDGQWIVVGVVSYGASCGEGDSGVYSRITYYLPWIKEKIARYGGGFKVGDAYDFSNNEENDEVEGRNLRRLVKLLKNN